ncbi:MAG TPA: hypothetical protein VFO75_01140 [Candidatus Dormibacteraeota bacterium]|nr:hypothetical protein [Candidatus Dormibacteraeota bacterium]
MVAPAMKAARRLIDNPHVFDQVVVTLAGIMVFGAYVTAYAYVIKPQQVVQPSATIGQSTVLAAWLLLVGVLFAEGLYGVRTGRSWDHALPEGYVGSLASALIFGVAWLIDTQYWTPTFEQGALGLDVLFTPPRLVEIAAVAVMVSGPLRAAARRGETEASVVTLLSASLLLSVITFATQFLHPLIDPWAWSHYDFLGQEPLGWLGKNEGVAAILAQALILAGTALLLNSGFKLRTGSLTFVFTLNGVLVVITKLHFEFVPVMILTGIAGDAWLFWTARRPGSPSASLCAVVGGAFATFYMIEVNLLDSDWSPSLWAGAILATTMICWLMGRLLRAGLPAVIVAPLAPPEAERAPEQLPHVEVRNEPRWPRDPASTVRPQLVRAALDDLGTPEALGRSPLGKLPGISQGGSTASDLRAVLVDVISELATSSQPRDAEAGRLLLDYYVKKVGSHEVIMERLHLSRPTFYRRLQRGFQLVAERLDEMSEFASKVPIAP